MDVERIFDEVCELLEAHGVFQTGLMENGEEEGIFKFRFLLAMPDEEDVKTRKRTRWITSPLLKQEMKFSNRMLQNRREKHWKLGVHYKKKDNRSFLYNLEAIKDYEDAQA